MTLTKEETWKLFDYVELKCQGMDAVYEDHIEHLVGCYGLALLIQYKFVETCGVVNGRQLYALCKQEKGK